MERFINIHIEKLPEGVYLATSDDVPGLVAQGRTVTEAMEIARDVARKLLEAQAERRNSPTLPVFAPPSTHRKPGRTSTPALGVQWLRGQVQCTSPCLLHRLSKETANIPPVGPLAQGPLC